MHMGPQRLRTNSESSWRCLLLIGLSFPLVSGFVLLALICWPNPYLELADRVRWRVSLPSVGQIQMESTLAAVQLRGDAVVSQHATLLFGDSHLHGMPTSALGGKVTNYAIAGEPASRMAARMRRYTSVNTAKQVIILSGSNDLVAGASPQQAADSVALAIDLVPVLVPVLLVELPPVRGNAISSNRSTALNIELASVCSQRPNCRLVRLQALHDAAGQLAAAYAAKDGVHLSAAGYQVLVDAITDSSPTSSFEQPRVIRQ
jgi:lysophospholipase L1-like esterase